MTAEVGPPGVLSLLDEQDTPRARLAGALRSLQDAVRGSLVDDARAASLAAEWLAAAAELRDRGVEDHLGHPGLRPGTKNHGQTLSPTYEVVEHAGHAVRGTVTFPRFHLGSEGAVHGGAIALWADDVLGRLGHEVSGDLTRTAYMHLDYRGLVPIDRPLEFTAGVESTEGRKRFLVATLFVDGVAAAEARGLWIQVRR